jgi:hypothetical protein
MDDPFSEKDRNGSYKKHNMKLYYVADPGTVPECPARGNAANESIVKRHGIFSMRVRSSEHQAESYCAMNDLIEAVIQDLRDMSIEEEKEPAPDATPAPTPVQEQDFFDGPEGKKLLKLMPYFSFCWYSFLASTIISAGIFHRSCFFEEPVKLHLMSTSNENLQVVVDQS